MAGPDSRGTEGGGNNAWAPLVLSLDGGGVRGLSSLYILREIMKAIKDLDERETDGIEQQDQALPKPCNYFDFIIGTSTGGLIAIMLGRLRMGVNECIQQYWIMTNRIFQPQRIRYIQLYSRRRVQDAAKEVVRQHCQCHRGQHDGCTGEEDLRQYDYMEDGQLRTGTCRVAVVTFRKGGRNTFGSQPADVPILFRSYDHHRRITRTDTAWSADVEYEVNPKHLDNAELKIHEACSCTSAAPTYFKSVHIRGKEYIDGGVTANNPAVIAWNEATQMANPPGNPWEQNVNPKVLISIGTGKAKAHTRFGTASLVKWALKNITDTDTAHNHAHALVNQARSRYFRFDVPERSPDSNHTDLSHIGMDESDDYPHEADPGPEAGFARPRREITRDVINRFKVEDEPLRRQATENGKKGGYKPNKYDYQTFDKIRDRTAAYCNSRNGPGLEVQNQIKESAKLLWSQSRERKRCNPKRWAQFRRHPDPNYS
ncbi:FabD/lysophospholipase-like protein [Paramyrothecium foliicola]|nr:FabD/lysophospholipase-like protein [Paramyrothecium foliicola]